MSQAAAPLQSLNLDAGKAGSIVNTGGLNATETGSADDAVLRFDAAAPTIAGPGITEATTAANGTIVTIVRPGWYEIMLRGVTTAGTTVSLGISSNVGAAGLNSDPDYAIAGFLRVQQGIVSAGTPANQPFSLTATLEVLKGNTALVRFHGTDNADGPPDFSGTLATVYYRIVWTGNTRGHS